MGGVVMYVNGEPCLDCAKLIANSGVRLVHGIRENRPSLPKVQELLLQSSIELILYDRDEVIPVPEPVKKTYDSHSLTQWKDSTGKIHNL
jgi:deoxycytidylate deaminase